MKSNRGSPDFDQSRFTDESFWRHFLRRLGGIFSCQLSFLPTLLRASLSLFLNLEQYFCSAQLQRKSKAHPLKNLPPIKDFRNIEIQARPIESLQYKMHLTNELEYMSGVIGCDTFHAI